MVDITKLQADRTSKTEQIEAGLYDLWPIESEYSQLRLLRAGLSEPLTDGIRATIFEAGAL